ncbi:MAG TPA: hypothetical protein PLE12_05125 [Propionicimonas sp.]|jgi:hypothetical protein|nr:hypothetical protein [Propionicimonas sp.]
MADVDEYGLGSDNTQDEGFTVADPDLDAGDPLGHGLGPGQGGPASSVDGLAHGLGNGEGPDTASTGLEHGLESADGVPVDPDATYPDAADPDGSDVTTGDGEQQVGDPFQDLRPEGPHVYPTEL